MTPRLASTLGLLAALGGAPAAAAEIDQKALFSHIHKTFNTPPELRLGLKDVKPAALPGFSAARLELGEGPSRQEQDILISTDGRFYIIGPAYKLGPSPVPGLRAPVQAADAPPAPQAHVTPDGQSIVFGQAMDLSRDPDEENRRKLRLQGAPSSGPAGAPVQIVEFSDLQCPHCKRAHDALESVTGSYGSRVRRVFKHYPLVHVHPWAYDAALAATCAGKLKPEASFALESGFFRDQESVTKESVRAKALELARQAGLDAAKFSSCLDGRQTKGQIDADLAEGAALSIGGTPALFINGRRLRGYDAREIRATIDEALSQRR